MIRRAEADRHLFHGGEDHHHVGVDRFGQLHRRKIFVDHRVDARQHAVFLHDRNSSSAAGDDGHALVDQLADGLFLDNADRSRRGDDLAVAAPGVFDHGHTGSSQFVGVFLAHEVADRLRWTLEGRIGGVDLDLRHEGGDAVVHLSGAEFVANGVLQVEADVAFAHGSALRKRHVGQLFIQLGSDVHGLLDHTDLRTIAVTHQHLNAGLDEIDDGARRVLDAFFLLFGCVSKSVAAQSDDDSFHYNLLFSQMEIFFSESDRWSV